MKKINMRQVVAMAIAAFMLLAGIVVSFSFFYSKVNETLSEQVSSYLTRNAQQNAMATRQLLSAEIAFVEGISTVISDTGYPFSGDISDAQILSILKSFANKKDYKRMGIADKSGVSITTDDLTLDLSDRSFIADAFKGKSGISKIARDKADGELINVIYAPILSTSGYPARVLFASYRAETYEQLLSLNWAGAQGEFFITSSRGDALISKDGSGDTSINVPDYISQNYIVPSPTNIANMRSQLGSGASGFFNVKDNLGNGHYVIYTPLGIENWVCVHIIPQTTADHQSSVIATYSGTLMLAISLLILAFVVVIVLIVYQNYKQLKSANRHLVLAEERYRILTEQTNNVIFDYNIKHSSIFYSTVFERKFGFVPHCENFPKCALADHWIFKEDEDTFVAAFKKCADGRPYLEVEVRLLAATGKYIWCLIRMTTLFNSDNQAYRIVGKISDIDATKRKNTLLTERSTRDGLTGLYNKETAKELITNYINGSNVDLRSCLLLVDIDNFKLVNDRLGHLMGDKCICEIARRMKATFSENEIIARVGGDEFIVFIKEVTDEAMAHDLGMKLCESMSSCSILDSAGVPYYVTASVGVSVTTVGALTSYESLFKQADTAMYRSKKSGKNRCSDYDTSQDGLIELTEYSDEDTEGVTISEIDDMDNSILSSLSLGSNFYEAVQLFLKEIGEKTSLNHVYIIEKAEGSNFRTSFEWYADSEKSTDTSLKPTISKSIVEKYKGLYNSDGIFYCSDIHALDTDLREKIFDSNVISTISAGIFHDEKFVGCLAADDCINTRIWSNGDVANISMLAKIVDNFIIGRSKQARVSRPTDTMPSVASIDIPTAPIENENE